MTNKLVSFVLTLSLISLTACGKFTRKGTINRDCTGTYLRLNNNDYLICNPEMTDSYAEGSDVKVKFNNASDCTIDQNPFGCELYHKNQGSIEIKEIE